MATGPLRFRTPHIEELPTTNTKQAPGFAWVAVAKDADPAKAALEVTSKKRARTGPAQNEAQREALSVRQQSAIERHVLQLNTDGSKDVYVPVPRKEGLGAGVKLGKTTNTKRILASGKEFKHILDDEEAELARTGKIDGLERDGGDGQAAPAQRASKMPLARRLQQERRSVSGSPTPSPGPLRTTSSLPFEPGGLPGDEDDGVAPLPTEAEMQAILDAPPLTYNAARVTAPPASAPPPRMFCEICGFWGRVKCMKCGARTCSVDCESVHVADRCLKFYA